LSLGLSTKIEANQALTKGHFELSKNQKLNESTKDFIIKVVKERNPETTGQLIRFVQETTNLPKKQIMVILNQLEVEDKLHFNAKQELTNTPNRTYLFSSESAWYWTIIVLALGSALSVFAIPHDLYPFAYVRNFFGVIFVLFLPGYAFARALLQDTVPFKTTSETFDTIERVILSIGLSIALAPMVGLILYYSPLGIGLGPVTLSLLAFTLVFATAAMVREYQSKSIVQQLNVIV
jgi:hypothetical protein